MAQKGKRKGIFDFQFLLIDFLDYNSTGMCDFGNTLSERPLCLGAASFQLKCRLYDCNC